MALGSLDSNGIGRYAEATAVGANFSGYMNEGLSSVSTALTTLLNKRAILGFRAASNAAMTALAGMAAGDMCYRTDNGITYRYNGAAWRRWESDWITYTPTLDGFAVGTGGSSTSVVQYRFENGRIRLKWRFVFGTASVAYPASPGFRMPGSGDPGGTVQLVTPLFANELLDSRITFNDSGSVYKGLAKYTNASDVDRIQFVSETAGGTATISAASPFGWGAGDGISGSCIADFQ